MKTKPPQLGLSQSPARASVKKRLSSSSASSSPTIPPPTTPHATFSSGASKSRGGAASFTISRSISACNRCRSRKTKCDQLFPSCTACAKAGVECIGIDAATGREIPRSYVDWLEKRVKHLEQMQIGSQGVGEGPDGAREPSVSGAGEGSTIDSVGTPDVVERRSEPRQDRALHLRPDIENLVDQVGLVGVQGASAPGFMGGSSGISFARLMFAAVKISGKDNQQTTTNVSNGSTGSSSPNGSNRMSTPETNPSDPSASSTNIPRHRQRVIPAPFPPRHEAERLMEVYFQQANPQFPILHPPSWHPIFRRACDRVEREGENIMNIVHGERGPDKIQHAADLYISFIAFAIASGMSQTTDNLPERYHASAMMCMDSLFQSVSMSGNRVGGLRGILLLALYSIMRPAAPGVWYVLGTALRLAVDLGLHQENTAKAEERYDPLELDERRRLWWCTYSLDRQVCVYLGRPFGIADEAVRTPFPLDVPDEYISAQGVLQEGIGRKSSRTIAIHMFRIRQLQSEIQQILYQAAELPRRFATLDDWRRDMEMRLQSWCSSVPKNQNETGCGYNVSFIDLNYQQTRLLLYGLCPAIPNPDVDAFKVIAESGSQIIRAYSNLRRERKINYAWLACHNLFMAGTSYLCAIWHCPQVRSTTTIEQIEFHTRAGIEVLGSMIDQCPAAQSCRDVFESLASATINLSISASQQRNPSDQRPMKRIKTELTPPSAEPQSWGTPTSETYPPQHPQLPASLANLLHHPPAQAAPPPPPTPPTPQHQEPPYGTYDPMGYNMHQQGAADNSNIDPVFRAVQGDLSPFLNQNGLEMQTGMDGSRLFEMIQEVGSGGAWDGGIPGNMGMQPVSAGAWGEFGGWGF